ncbi:MAG TPA: DUF1599 domain-containing protein [Firmicutes bacterium]|nr:DUF1599 domain-containing protein [Bacillota bacterium]
MRGSSNCEGGENVVHDPVTFQEGFQRVVDDLGELMFRKQHDYGPGNILAFGEFGVLVRLNDKLERLKNLYKKGVAPANESVEDSWRDAANYAIIALMLRRGWFTLPLAEEPRPEKVGGTA